MKREVVLDATAMTEAMLEIRGLMAPLREVPWSILDSLSAILDGTAEGVCKVEVAADQTRNDFVVSLVPGEDLERFIAALRAHVTTKAH